MEKFEINSGNGYSLSFHSPETNHDGWLESYLITIQTPEFTAKRKVYNHPAGSSPSAIFHDCAKNWKGWKNKKEWKSMEGELLLSAAIDSTGHVSLFIKIASDHTPQNWKIETMLIVESGQLDQIAKNSKKFFEK